jgi:hypothetical protein
MHQRRQLHACNNVGEHATTFATKQPQKHALFFSTSTGRCGIVYLRITLRPFSFGPPNPHSFMM